VLEGWVMSALGVPAVVLLALVRTRARGTYDRRLAVESAFVMWLFVAAGMLFFPVFVQPAARAAEMAGLDGSALPRVSLAPLGTIVGLLTGTSPFQAIRQIGGNLGVLFPVGLFAPALFRRVRDWRAMALLAVALGVGVEALQYLEDASGWVFRVVDVDDALLNAVGVMLGYALWRLASTWTPAR
jgi:glycopeptide antibiotics resistance protein